jgi:hypothetical protein
LAEVRFIIPIDRVLVSSHWSLTGDEVTAPGRQGNTASLLDDIVLPDACSRGRAIRLHGRNDQALAFLQPQRPRAMTRCDIHVRLPCASDSV